MIATIDINFVRMSNKIVWKYPISHISSLLNITKHFFGLDKSVLSKCKFCAMFYLVEFDDKKNSLSVDLVLVCSLWNIFSCWLFCWRLRHILRNYLNFNMQVPKTPYVKTLCDLAMRICIASLTCPMIVLQCPQLAVTRDINQGSGRTLVISQTAFIPIEFAYDLVYSIYRTFMNIKMNCFKP